MAKFFNGETKLVVDDKHRIQMPASARAQIEPDLHGAKFILLTMPEGVVGIYPEKTFEEMAMRLTSSLAPDESQADFERLMFAGSETVEPDKAGRLLVPERLLEAAGIVKEATLIGARDRFELWPSDRWKAASADMAARRGELIQKFKASRLERPPAAEPGGKPGV